MASHWQNASINLLSRNELICRKLVLNFHCCLDWIDFFHIHAQIPYCTSSENKDNDDALQQTRGKYIIAINLS